MKAGGGGWQERCEGWRLERCEPPVERPQSRGHCSLFSIYSPRLLTENRSLYLLLIQTSPFLPPGCPALRAVRPLPCSGGQASLPPARRLQVMACEMTGLLSGGRLAKSLGRHIYGAAVVFLPAYKYIGKVGPLTQTMMGARTA